MNKNICLVLAIIFIVLVVMGSRQNDFRTFCMSEETEKIYYKLEEVINI